MIQQELSSSPSSLGKGAVSNDNAQVVICVTYAIEVRLRARLGVMSRDIVPFGIGEPV